MKCELESSIIQKSVFAFVNCVCLIKALQGIFSTEYPFTFSLNVMDIIALKIITKAMHYSNPRTVEGALSSKYTIAFLEQQN